MKALIATTTILILAWTATIASADVVVFKNGDRLTGEIVRMTDGKLVLKTDAAGEVPIDMTAVSSFATDKPVAVHLADGSVLNQTFQTAEGDKIAAVSDDTLAAQTVSIDRVTAINPPPKKPPTWDGNVTAGYTLTTGNSETETRTLDASLRRRTEKDRTTLKAAYRYGEQEDDDGETETTIDNWFGSLQYDYFVSKKVYTYGRTRVEQDDIADLDLRLILGGGVGYQWVDTETCTFETEGGLAWLYENYEDADSEEEISLQLGYNARKQLNERVEFLHDLTVTPALSDITDYFLTTSAELRADLTTSIYGSAKVVLDYDKSPAPGTEKTDVLYTLGIGIRF